jgi:ribosome-associated protein
MIIGKHYTWGCALEPIDEAHIAIEAASDKQATDIVLLDMNNICDFADYFIICSGESGPQIKAIYDEIELRLKKAGVRTIHTEGSIGSGWLLLDYGSLIVHIFSPRERDYYQLEKLWGEANMVVRIQ